MKIIFILLFCLACCSSSFAAKNLHFGSQLANFQNDTFPKTNLNKLDTFYCGAIETEACIDSTSWHSYISYRTNQMVDSIGSIVSPGIYIVRVIFLIERNGSISNAKALNDPGYNFSMLAEQIIQHGPLWEPSTRNGKFTRTYKKENITFIVPKKNTGDSIAGETLLL